MKLSQHGTIKFDGGFLARRTDSGAWMVSQSGNVIGYADMLIEINTLIEAHIKRSHERLEQAQRSVDAHRLIMGMGDDYTDASMHEGEMGNPNSWT
jgi:hypothetical protein